MSEFKKQLMKIPAALKKTLPFGFNYTGVACIAFGILSLPVPFSYRAIMFGTFVLLAGYSIEF